ncbi:helix-turn-helix transcriptional regulator [Rothia sp. P5766]|uniref:helix-turn-helix transcriptional regulator n=1 Tax=Rothia sp. P5766 TaxID=3402656 RepID=UPI003AD8E08D
MATATATRTEFYSVSDLCRILGVSDETLRRWRRQGKVPPPVMIGRSPKWPPSDLEFMVQMNREGA